MVGSSSRGLLPSVESLVELAGVVNDDAFEEPVALLFVDPVGSLDLRLAPYGHHHRHRTTMGGPLIHRANNLVGQTTRGILRTRVLGDMGDDGCSFLVQRSRKNDDVPAARPGTLKASSRAQNDYGQLHARGKPIARPCDRSTKLLVGIAPCLSGNGNPRP